MFKERREYVSFSDMEYPCYTGISDLHFMLKVID